MFEFEVMELSEVLSDYVLPGFYGSFGSVIVIMFILWGFIKLVNFIKDMLLGVDKG